MVEAGKGDLGRGGSGIPGSAARMMKKAFTKNRPETDRRQGSFPAGHRVRMRRGHFAWSTAIACNCRQAENRPDQLGGFLGRREIPRASAACARSASTPWNSPLLADGVKPADIVQVLGTKAGVDRAFKKLDQLKPDIQWWEAGAQPPQFLASGDVVMSSAC